MGYSIMSFEDFLEKIGNGGTITLLNDHRAANYYLRYKDYRAVAMQKNKNSLWTVQHESVFDNPADLFDAYQNTLKSNRLTNDVI